MAALSLQLLGMAVVVVAAFALGVLAGAVAVGCVLFAVGCALDARDGG